VLKTRYLAFTYEGVSYVFEVLSQGHMQMQPSLIYCFDENLTENFKGIFQ
jgi:hypothetical protein